MKRIPPSVWRYGTVAALLAGQRIFAGDTLLVCIGRITHRDHNGVEREVGFRRKLAAGPVAAKPYAIPMMNTHTDPGRVAPACRSRFRGWTPEPVKSGIITPSMKQFAGMLLASVCMATCPGCKPAPELEVRIKPPEVTIPDNSKRGTQLAKVSVGWSDGAKFIGNVRLTENPGGICQLVGMELQLGRDTTKADDYTIPVCTVTAFKEGDGRRNSN